MLVIADSVGGGGGIRTHGSLRFTRFPSAPIRPLSHPSESSLRRMRRVNDGRLSESTLVFDALSLEEIQR